MAPIPARYRLDVAARLVAAVAGGYAIAALVAIAGAWALPLPRIEAATVGTLAALLAMPAASMGCFWARSAAAAWAGTGAWMALLAATAFAGGWRP